MKELLDEIQTKFYEFSENAEKQLNGNKSAGLRARTLSSELDKKLKAFRKESLELSKK